MTTKLLAKKLQCSGFENVKLKKCQCARYKLWHHTRDFFWLIVILIIWPFGNVTACRYVVIVTKDPASLPGVSEGHSEAVHMLSRNFCKCRLTDEHSTGFLAFYGEAADLERKHQSGTVKTTRLCLLEQLIIAIRDVTAV